MSLKVKLELIGSALLVGASFFTTSCAVQSTATRDTANSMQVSVPEQKLALFRHGVLTRTYPISTSKFGLGDEPGSYRTPLGTMEVAEKIGEGKPAGAVFKSRKWTGEVIEPDSPGRDPIVSRILWLNGLEPKNKNAYSRCIYIHGTAAEKDIGKAVSYGCIRMKSKDVIDLHDSIGEGATVSVVRKKIPEPMPEVIHTPEPIRAIPLTDQAIPVVMNSVEPPAVKPVWNEVGNFRSGYDVLEEEGFNPEHLTVVPIPSL